MAKRKIEFALNSGSIEKAIRETEKYKSWVKQKCAELAKRLAEIGAEVASVGFGGADYDGVNDVSVSVEATDNGYKIIASGGAVFFIEFGAGVYYNGEEPYPLPRPEGIVGIGQFGEGKGKQNAWGYYDESGNLVLTHGNPAAMPMYSALRTMEQQVKRIAKEVFG